MEKSAYINSVSAYLPNSPISNFVVSIEKQRGLS